MREDPHESLADRYRQALTPAPPAIDQHAMWYAAGRASVTPRRNEWLLKVYSGVMTATAASLALVMSRGGDPAAANRSEPTTSVVVVEPLESEPPVDSSPTTEVGSPEQGLGLWAALFSPQEVDPDSYLARRERALDGDLDSLSSSLTRVELRPGIEVAPSPPATRQRLLEEYLPERDRRVPERPTSDPQTESIIPPAKELA